MTTQCCEKCRHLGLPEAYSRPHASCPCHQTHTTKEGWEERFDTRFLDGMVSEDAVAYAKSIKAFIAYEIQKAQVEVLDEVDGMLPNKDGNELTIFANKEHPFVYRADHSKGKYERKMFAMGYLQAKKHIAERIRARITNQSGK